jgi:ABC-2 type transport system permease protein
MLFWFALAFLVNLLSNSSAKNAVSLLGLWVVFVLLVPSVLNQLGNTLYPMPPRTLMINEMRLQKAEATKQQDKILDNYLRDHPEYAINDSTQSRSFWHGYMASQKLVKEALAPIVGSYEEQLSKQQDWTRKMQWISPAIIAQESLNSLAGTSTQDYEAYRKQVVQFAELWRAHFMPFLFNNTLFTTNDHDALPQFQYQPLQQNGGIQAMSILLLMALVLLGLGFAMQSVPRQKGILSDQ